MSTLGTAESGGALLTDLYQLTMLQSQWQHGITGTAVFEMFVRRLPSRRNFLIAAGLEQVLDYLEGLRFDDSEIAWLRQRGRFAPGFLDWLADLRFHGDVFAMPEGTVFFADEPILRIVAPFPAAQLVETRIINILHYQSLIASKAARMVMTRPGSSLIDFGLRRAHGAEAGLFAARASYIAGFAGSATLEAERRYGIPAFGTMAHSFIQAHASEREAFRNFARSWPNDVILLIDTYDTEAGAKTVVELAPALAEEGIRVKGVRLDSGDMIALSRAVRRILDAGGLRDSVILASSSVDEYYLARVNEAGAPIDAFGIGTLLATSADAPYLDCAYKLQEYAGRPCRKRSTGKATWPGRKQVFRVMGDDGRMAGDTLTVEDDSQPGTPLIHQVMEGGRRIAPPEPLGELRRRAAAGIASFAEPLRRLDTPAHYPVAVAPALLALAEEADAATAQMSLLGGIV